MAKLRHLALHSENPEAAAEFYKRAFGMREISRKTDSPLASLNIYLTDGTIHLAILKYRTAELARSMAGRKPTASVTSAFGWKMSNRPGSGCGKPAPSMSIGALPIRTCFLKRSGKGLMGSCST